jgi:hypothetical protein
MTSFRFSWTEGRARHLGGTSTWAAPAQLAHPPVCPRRARWCNLRELLAPLPVTVGPDRGVLRVQAQILESWLALQADFVSSPEAL